MRVALITPEMPFQPGGGGIGNYTAIAAGALAGLGHEVCVVSRGADTGLEQQGVASIAVNPPSLPHPHLARLAAVRGTARAVRRWRPDVVQAAEWEAIAWWIARRRSSPLVTCLHTPTYLVDELNGRPHEDAKALLRRMERDQARRSAALVAPSRAIAQRVGRDWRLDPQGIQVIPNPLDTDAVRRAGEQRPPCALPSRFLAFTGRLERRKGVSQLGVALALVLERHADVHAVLIGRDTGEHGGAVLRELLRATAPVEDRVHLLGDLPRAAALAVVARAELVVLPSLWEAFGLVATEAFALGRPVVATLGSGLAEIVENGRSGWLVPPGDADELARVLDERLGDPDGLRRASEEARRRAADFEAEAIAKRLAGLYERVLAERRPGNVDRS